MDLFIKIEKTYTKNNKTMPDKLIKIFTENFHKIELIYEFKEHHYNAFFIYKDETIPLEPRKDIDRSYDLMKSGSLEVDGKKIKGVLFFNSTPLDSSLVDKSQIKVFESDGNKNIMTFFDKNDFIEINNVPTYFDNETIEELLSSASTDYPFLPLQEYKKKLESSDITYDDFKLADDLLKIDPSNVNLNMISNFIKYRNSKKEVNFEKIINFWKQYSLERMTEIMEKSSLFDKDSISSCPYLSIGIIKKYPLFKWNWSLVTENGSIYARDILCNPDLDWDESGLIGRNLPKGFFEYKNVNRKLYDISEYPEKIEWKEIDILLSPEEPPEYPSNQKIDIQIDEKDINDAIDLIKEEVPELFEEENETLLDKIRLQVIENIKENDGTFVLNDFILPEEDEKNVINESSNLFWERKKLVLPEPTEDDPYSVRDIIKNFKEGIKDNFYLDNEAHKYYDEKIKLKSNDDFYVQNRKEYELYIANHKASFLYSAEECVFFEFEDVERYPKAFFYKLKKNATEVYANSGKLTLEYVLEHPDLEWKANDLVKALPIDYVIKNLLFYPDRIKLPFIVDNKFLPIIETDKIRLELLIQDKKLMKTFCDRENKELDGDIFFQYPHIPLNYDGLFIDIPCHLKNKVDEAKKLRDEKIKKEIQDQDDVLVLDENLLKLKAKNKSEDKIDHLNIFPDFKEIEDLSLYSWEYFRTKEGIQKLLKITKNKILKVDKFMEFSDLNKDISIFSLIVKSAYLMETLSDVIPIGIINGVKANRMIAPNYVSLHKIFEFYKKTFENTHEFWILYIFLQKNRIIGTLSKELINVFEIVIKDKYDSVKDKTIAYEFFVDILPIIFEIYKNLNMDYFSLSPYSPEVKKIISITSMFTIEEIGRSKYSYPEKIIDTLLLKNK